MKGLAQSYQFNNLAGILLFARQFNIFCSLPSLRPALSVVFQEVEKSKLLAAAILNTCEFIHFRVYCKYIYIYEVDEA